jgi:hypothetical protein
LAAEVEIAMHSIVQDKLETLKELCVKHRVERLDIFGSAAREDFNPESSDLDFLVEFEAILPWSMPTRSSVSPGGSGAHVPAENRPVGARADREPLPVGVD